MKATETVWYTTQFITSSLRRYLIEKGFRVNDPEEQNSSNLNTVTVILSTKLISKEVIEIRGTIAETSEIELEKWIGKNQKSFIEVTHLILDIMLSPINLFNSISGYEGDRCLCLPDTDTHRRVLERLKDYFVLNELHLKIYLIDQPGSVEVVYLNPERRVRKKKRIESKD